ncbi:MAG: HAD-IA family hydrolase [Odoribacteraceae bacterium]|jgi:phosphoglycolate phosphatase|nr:HAD-IA family hydrolase [Odoribacteraceae bacterium]
MTKLIIFDLDGTLIDSLADLAASANHALRARGFPGHPLDAYRYFVGNGVVKLLERALPEDRRDRETLARLFEEFTRYYGMHRADLTAPYPGITALLEELKRRGMLLAVASNKYHSAADAMTRLYFGDTLFDFVHGHQEDVPTKPHPAIALEILSEAGVAPGEAFFVGDSGVDMQTARAAGIRSIGVTWGFRAREELLENGADFIIDSPRELLPLVSC